MSRKEEFRDRMVNVAWNVKAGLISYLRAVFSEDEVLTYDDDEKITRIDITDRFPEKESIGARPAIIILRQATYDAPESVSLDEGMQNYDWASGAVTYNVLSETDLVIQCLSREGSEAEYIACLVRMAIRADSRPLASMGVRLMKLPVIGAEAKIPEFPDGIAVPVNFSVTYPQQWRAKIGPVKKVTSIQANISGLNQVNVPNEEL